jgi:hypothetical protein
MSDDDLEARRKEFDDLMQRGFIPTITVLDDGTNVIRWTPEVVEWWAATSTYRTARNGGALTKALCERVREAWLMVKGQVELNDAEQELVDEALETGRRLTPGKDI